MLKLGLHICTKSLLFNVAKNSTNRMKEEIIFQTQIVRHTSFFNKINADLLWKGLTSVSNAGKKRGRGRGADKRTKKNLNVGQKTGFGSEEMVWPGLTCSVLQGNTLVNIEKLPKQQKTEAPEEIKISKKRMKVHALERGWTSRSYGGRHIGPPAPVGYDTYENFDSVVIEHKMVAHMTANLGKKRRFSSFVLTGNKNGLIGLGEAKCLEGRSSVRLANSRAIKNLVAINLIDKHTVNHDFFCQFGSTKIFVFKKPKGHGLTCQRVIKVCCELLGIKDLAANIEGAINYKHIVRAFLLGLVRQKTYQEIADDKKLHLVEFSKESYDFPKVLASPKECLSESEAKNDPVGFQEYIMGNKLIYNKPKKVPFYEKLPSWQIHLKRTLYKRNHDKVKIELLAKYGEYKSHLSDVFPECKFAGHRNPKKTEEA